jgi:hypothetical protein
MSPVTGAEMRFARPGGAIGTVDIHGKRKLAAGFRLRVVPRWPDGSESWNRAAQCFLHRGGSAHLRAGPAIGEMRPPAGA